VFDLFEYLTCLARLNANENKIALEEKPFVIELCHNSIFNHKRAE
jgi:hypothetical protein